MRIRLTFIAALLGLSFGSLCSAYDVQKVCPNACGNPATITCTNLQDSGCNGTTCICVDLCGYDCPPERDDF